VKNMPELSKELIRTFFNGDEASFKIIFRFYYPRLFHFVHEYIPPDDLAENIVQDTFLTLWNNRALLLPDTNLNAWLYTVARNNCLKKLRDEKFSKKLIFSGCLNEAELELNLDALSQLDTSGLTFSEIERIIQATLESLPPQCRVIFEKSRFENKKNREIAEELDISIKAVEAQMTKALKLFKESLKDYLPLVAWLFIQ
jgi:RNA polymerase sigma-70 factor (ECF subfamily)